MTALNHSVRPDEPGEVFLFGIPIGGLGWFQTLLMGTAAGFAAFFAGTFLGIVGIGLANGMGHAGIDFSMAYLRVGLPLGLLVLVVSLGYLTLLRLRRIGRR